MAEMIDIYDENKQKTGVQLPRSSRLEKGQYMLYVLALIEDNEHRFLITQRSLNKKWAAGSWEIPGGGSHAGETSLDAVRREVKEETGLDISGCDAKVIYSYKNEDLARGDNYFVDIYRCSLDYTIDDVTMQKTEVIDTRLASIEEITALNGKDGFLHYKRICEALGI